MRMHTKRGFMLLVAMALVATMLPLGLASAEEHGIDVEMVVAELRNPRQMGIAAGSLFVAEAGTGGDECFAPEPEHPEFVMCYGTTGRITEIDLATGVDGVVIDGLPSLAGEGGDDEPPGWFAVGPHGVAPRSPADGVVVMGFGGPPEIRDMLADDLGPPAEEFGTLLHADFVAGTREIAADLADYEQAENPDGGDPEEHGIDTNPYAVLLDGDDAIVADAGGNSLLRVPLDPGGQDETPIGDIETIAAFPRNFQPMPPFIPAPRGFLLPGDPVPTSITQTADGDYLVGELPGFPFQPGAARVWSVDPDTVENEPELELHVDGFATIIDLAVGPDGHLYVLEIANLGLLAAEFEGDFRGGLVRYDADTGRREVLLTDPLFAPAGMAFDGDDLYISNCGVCGDEGDAPEMTGHILRLTGVEDAEPLAFTEPVEAETDENQPVEIDVLDNDSEGLEIGAVVDSGNGATLVNTITYQPRAHFSGEDRIKYQACNEDACVIGEAQITVNDLPTGRYDGATRIETAIRVARGHFPAGADTVLIARSDRYPDALAGAVLGAAVNAPVLLTPSDQLHPAVIEEINRMQASSAYILGGTAAVSQAVEDAIVAQTSVAETTRAAGPDRFATAVEIRAELENVTGEAATSVYVAEGAHEDDARGWPDVLSVSYLAARQGQPILLVTHGQVPAATEASLADGIAAATIVGGVAAVSAAVEARIDELVADVDRVEGSTRYETSSAVAAEAIADGADPKLLYLATGGNWPDALTAAPSVALDGSVMLLVAPSALDNSPPVRTYLEQHRPFTDIDLLGGVSAISDAVEQQIRQAAAGG